MRRVLAIVTIAALAACSDSATTLQPAHDRLGSGGQQLSFTVSDAPAQPGVLFIAGDVVGAQGSVTFTRTQYGSTCRNELTAHADVTTGKITLFVDIAERLTVCTADVRALTYKAQLSGLAPGDYELSVVHTNPDKSSAVVYAGRAKVT